MISFKKLIKTNFTEIIKYAFNFSFIIQKDIKQFNAVIATKNGLFIFNKSNNKLIKVLHGSFYGVAVRFNRLIVFEAFHGKINKGRIIELFVEKGKIVKSKVVLKNLSSGIHQIDIFDNLLYVCNTYNNSIDIYSLEGYKLISQNFPLGSLTNGRKSKNYGHINSIYIKNCMIHFVSHNETKKTGKSSEIFTFDMNFSLLKKIDTNSGCVHNVIFKDYFYFFDSLNGLMKQDQATVFSSEFFLRGLAITDDDILVGCSEYSDRGSRIYGTGNLYVLSQDFKIKSNIKIPSMVHEIRIFDDIDLGRSNSEEFINLA